MTHGAASATGGGPSHDGSTASFTMAVLLRMEQVDDAVAFLRRAIALAEQTMHPALGETRALLDQLARPSEQA